VPGTGKTYAFVPASSSTDAQGYPDSLAEVTIATGTTIAAHVTHPLVQKRYYTVTRNGRTYVTAAGAVSPLIGLTPGPAECAADVTHSNLYIISGGTIYPSNTSPIINEVNVSSSAAMTLAGTFTTDATTGFGYSGFGANDISGIVYDGTDSAVIIATDAGYELYSGTSPFAKIKGIAGTPAENFGYNPITNQVWSPTYGSFPLALTLVDIASGKNYALSPAPITLSDPDSGAVDPSTNIAISPEEGPGVLHVVNLNGATTSGTTLTAPETDFTLTGTLVGALSYIPASGVDAMTHTAFLSGEFGSTSMCVAVLPSTKTTTAPAMGDYACAAFPATPDGNAFSSPFDPHATSTFDLGTKGYGLMFNQQDTFVAVIDLAAFLAAPRDPTDPHAVSQTYNLLTNNVIFYIPI
jgi:hypothetical protein